MEPDRSGKGCVLCAVLAAFFLFCACGEKKDKRAGAGPGGTPFGVTPGMSTPQGFKFPHPENTANPEIHGVWVDEAGTALCLGCHKIDRDENTPAPFCRSCHPLCPHETNWNHGDYVAMNGRGNCRTKCHGPDLLGGLSKVACRNCHHTAGWSGAAAHGPAAAGDGKLTCRTCHGDDYRGGRSLISCYDCHPHYPHTWNRHGPVVQRAGEAACSTSCHGADRLGGLSGIACGTCHHPAGWKEPTAHGVVAIGNRKLTCRPCHGDDLAGGIAEISCFNPDCHKNYLHPAGWKDLHGAFVLNSGKDVCATRCHGQDFAGGLSGVACNNPDCHEYPHTGPNWNTGEGHGRFLTTAGFRSISASACFTCHDRPVYFQRSDTREFLTNRSDCYRCHWAYPHIGWIGPFVSPNWEREGPACLQNPVGHAHWDEGYLQWSPLMMVSDGVRLNQTDSDDVHITAFNFTCGREDGFCHFGGARSRSGIDFEGTCIILCHSSALPARPVLPDCEPPAERQLPGAPRVIMQEVTPRNSARNVSRNLSRVDMHFNEPMRRETILAPGTFYLQKNTVPPMILAGIVSCDTDWCMQAGLTGFGTLDYDTPYSVRVTTAAEDWGGTALTPFTSSFRTEHFPTLVVRDKIPIGTVEENNPIIRVTFNRNVQCPAGSECMRLARLRDGHVYSGSTSCGGRNCAFTTPETITFLPGCDPTEDDSCPETYEVRATTAIQSAEGARLSSDYTWQFSVDIRW